MKEEHILKKTIEWLRREYTDDDVDQALRQGWCKRMRDEVCAFKAGYEAALEDLDVLSKDLNDVSNECPQCQFDRGSIKSGLCPICKERRAEK